MHYILADNGYVDSIGFVPFNCKGKDSVEYNGTVPTGFETLEEWARNSNIRAYKIVNNNLTYDAARDEELQEKWQSQLYTNALTQKSEDGKKIYIINENEEAEEILNVEHADNLQNYSTEEQVIGTWIDGKPLYRIVKTFTSMSSIPSISSNIDTIIKSSMMLKASASNGSDWRPFPWLYATNSSFGTGAWAGGYFIQPTGAITIQAGSSITSIERGILIVEYTKTTDTATIAIASLEE